MAYGVASPDFPSDGCAIVFGASGGLGQATAGLMAERGSNVVATYHSRAKPAEDVVADIRKLGRKAAAMPCDVTDRASIAKLVSAALAEFGRIHTVVSAGGLVFETMPMLDFPGTKKILDLAVEATPLHRLAQCEEVAEAIAFLASAKASYISGQHLMVDGGLSA
ncbi:MAG: SDR family oxidoreductase [Rhodocyclaceae bacterium]|jgi:NAD(P)-dependent dehydrogenase (short-subunit alcohol dehydrogenase family)|nr:SDR family oxidoreductase [Rhodocyclaceae bacterium]